MSTIRSIVAQDLKIGDHVNVIDPNEPFINASVYVSRLCKQSVHLKWKDGKYYGYFKTSKKGFVPVVHNEFFMDLIKQVEVKSIEENDNSTRRLGIALMRLHALSKHVISDEFNEQKSTQGE